MENFIESRLDSIGQAVANKPEFGAKFNECCRIYESLKNSIDPALVERLESAHASLMGTVEQEYYLAGLRDGRENVS